jgi:DNA-directed RNA polymerase specialized sigma24 family protein
MGAVKRQVYNDSLMNMAKYNNLKSLQHLLNNLGNLEKLAEMGDSVSASIVVDLKGALSSDKLTEKQSECLKLKYQYKYTNNEIAEELNLKSDNSVRKHLQGAIKKIRRELGGDG